MKSMLDNKICADMDVLEDCYVLDENNHKVSLQTLWNKQTAILIFLRHFACDACRKHALEIWKNRTLLESKGASIHFIGNGDPQFIKTFKEQYNLEAASFYTDPKLKVFKAAGFKKGFWISPGEMHTRSEFLWLAVRYQLRKTGQGNVWQLGGALVVKPSGKIAYQFISMSMDDFPPSRDLLIND